MNTKVSVFLILLLTVLAVNSQDVSRWRSQVMRNYDLESLPPQNDGKPVLVTFYMKILNVQPFDEKANEFSIDLYFRQTWTDKRLASSGLRSYITLRDKSKLWTPDIFFRNQRSGVINTVPNPTLLARIHPDGNVLVSQQLHLTLSCPRNLKYYPLDRNRCKLDMGMYSYNSGEVTLKARASNAVTISGDNITIPGYKQITKFDLVDCSESYKTSTGSYACFRIYFDLIRQPTVFILTYYIPSCILVAISWIQFWLKFDAVGAKVLLALFSFSMLLIQLIVVNVTGASAGILTVLHFWLFVCCIFAMMSLFEIGLAHYVLRGKEDVDLDSAEKDHPIERISRGLFPVLFIIFIVVYWSAVGINSKN